MAGDVTLPGEKEEILNFPPFLKGAISEQIIPQGLI